MLGQTNQKEAHKVLLQNDQLRREMIEGRVFHGLCEPPLNFRPTYKFDDGSDVYDTSKKLRIPSWTDRILHKPCDGLETLIYRSIEDIKSSDHRPVVAVMKAPIEVRDSFSDKDSTSQDRENLGLAESQVCVIS